MGNFYRTNFCRFHSWPNICENFICEFSFLESSVKILSCENFPLYGISYTCSIYLVRLPVSTSFTYILHADVNIYFRNASYSNNSYVTTGSSSRVNITCTLEGIDSREAQVAWYYPNGLVVGGAHGRGPYQTNTSSVEEKKVESVLTWQRSVLFEGSFNGEGFYRCHVTTNYGREESVYLGIFAKIPGS